MHCIASSHTKLSKLIIISALSNTHTQNIQRLHDDGHTYDEASLKEWLSQNNRSPLTGVDLKNKSYTRNYALQSAIQQFEDTKKKQISESELSSNMDISQGLFD